MTSSPHPLPRRTLVAAAAAVVATLSGCATTAVPASGDAGGAAVAAALAPPRPDPWENWNRKVFKFNDAIDTAVLKPVATAYTRVLPQPVRTGVTKVYANVSDVWSAVNNMLQGKVANGFDDVMRVGANTLFGLGGLFDVATDMGLDRHGEDFGQTLGRWGFGAGPYIVWPLLGPSSVRDSAALPLDLAVSPALAAHTDGTRAAVTVLGAVNTRANLLPTTRMLDDMALDKYSFVRDAYLQRRRSLVYDGNEPEAKDDGAPAQDQPADDPKPAPASTAPAASGASQPGR